MAEVPIVEFVEKGSSTSSAWGTLISSIANTDFSWPEIWEEFDEIRRTNPEVTIVRMLYTSTARDVNLKYEPPADFTPEDEEFTDFLNSCLADIDLEKFKETLITQVPLMGWGVWEIVPGLRVEGWKAPDGEIWESFNTDGLIGIRKLAWRDQSTLEKFKYNDVGNAEFMVQRVWPAEAVDLLLANCLHLMYGDQTIPTGLSPFQAVTRLRRIKHALEIVQGMGFEHAAGHVKFTVKGKLTDEAKVQLEETAKALMTAAQGSYATEIEDQFEFDLEDVTFSAAADLLKTISYYGMVILQIFASHFIAVATTADTGSYSAASDHSAIYLAAFNAIMGGFAKQTGRQLARYLRLVNGDKFKNITAYPELKASEVKKVVDLSNLAQFLTAFSGVFPMSEDDAAMIRERSRVLPTEQPGGGEDIVKAKAAPGFPTEAEVEEALSLITNLENVNPKGEPTFVTTGENQAVTEEEIAAAIDVFNAFCDEFYPKFRGLLEAKVKNAGE